MQELCGIGDLRSGFGDGCLACVFAGHVELIDAVAQNRCETDIVSACRDSYEVKICVECRNLFGQNLGCVCA